MTEEREKYASLLVRVSRKSREHTTSLGTQEDDCEKVALENGYKIYATYVDDGLSGAKRDRPGFQQWLEDGRSGKVDCLIAWNTDRITREGSNVTGPIFDIVEGKDPKTGKVSRKPIRMMTGDGMLDSQTNMDLFRSALTNWGEFARAERMRTVARATRAQAAFRELPGRYRGGSIPYGYQTKREISEVSGKPVGSTLVPHPEESAVVREMAERVLNGETLYAIAKDLNRRGVKPRRGENWRIVSLWQILTSDHICGYRMHAGKAIRDQDGMPIPWFEPVLSPETVDQLRGILVPETRAARGEVRNMTGKRGKVTHLLSGLLRAECCGTVLYAGKPDSYREPADRKPCDRSRVSVKKSWTETYVETEFLRWFGHMEEMRPVRTVADRPRLAELRRASDALWEKVRDRNTPKEEKVEIMDRATALDEQIQDLEGEPEVEEWELVPTGRTLGEAWRAGTVQTRNQLLRDHLTGPITVIGAEGARIRHYSPEYLATRVHIPWIGHEGIPAPVNDEANWREAFGQTADLPAAG